MTAFFFSWRRKQKNYFLKISRKGIAEMLIPSGGLLCDHLLKWSHGVNGLTCDYSIYILYIYIYIKTSFKDYTTY